MLLTRIEASGFRNLEGCVEAAPRLNILYGDNAQGKTNWLEAIYVLGTTKSFRTSQVRESIAFDQSQSLLRGETLRATISKQLQLLLTESSKELYVNGKRETLARYLGNLDVFVFSLEEMDVIRGEPSERRRFLDRGIAVSTPAYIDSLSRYNQVIKQKNRLLGEASESANPSDYKSQIQAWNDQLVEMGADIYSDSIEQI